MESLIETCTGWQWASAMIGMIVGYVLALLIVAAIIDRKQRQLR